MGTQTEEAVFFWSGGKDSAAAYYEITTDPRYSGYRVTGLLTTFTAGYDRGTGHGVRRSLIEQQAGCLGIDLSVSYIPRRASMGQYVDTTSEVLHEKKSNGTSLAATGDIFVEKERLALSWTAWRRSSGSWASSSWRTS